MADDARQGRVKVAMSIAAIGLAVPGIALTFAPREIGELAGLQSAPIVLQLLGAALLGFAVMNWTARGSMLGGIYGRAVVAANQMHFTVGGLALARHVAYADGPLALWALAIFYLLGAALFLQLMFFGGPGR